MEKLIYGSEISKNIKLELKDKITALVESGKRAPHLAVILIGDNVGSMAYVKGKSKGCEEVGMLNTMFTYDDTISEVELLEKIEELNHDDTIDGILVQLPLPKHIDENKVLYAIDPSKDVDGFHPFNMGCMMIDQESVLPCTPKGIMRILDIIGYGDLSGKRAIVIGRSNIVGKPIAQLLLRKNATVTIAHSRTKNIEALCAEHDVVVVAIGKPRFVKKEWIKEGAVVIDVGINRSLDNKLCGDVDSEDCLEKVKYITPVPKGIGPMTIAMLLENTLEAYERKLVR